MTKEQKDKLILIAGADNVVLEGERLEKMSSATGFVKGFKPSCVVKVSNPHQVQDIVKLANDEGLKLVPVSSSSNEHLHGGCVPAVEDVIAVDLSGMKTIYDADRTFRMIVIEPGVTYEELQPAIAEKGLMIDMPLAPKAGKSVITSLLENEPRINPNMQWNVNDPLRSTEVVWGDANRMRTGEAAGLPMNLDTEAAVKFSHETKHSYMFSANGPGLIDYYRLLTGSQGTMGIVTWASIRCALLPDLKKAFIAGSDDVEKCVEFLYNMEHLRAGDGMFVLNKKNFALLMSKDADSAAALEVKLPEWIALAVAASRPPLPEMRLAGQVECIEQSAGNAGLRLGRTLVGLRADDVMTTAFTPCKEGDYWRDRAKGASADIVFITTMDRFGKYWDILSKEAKNLGMDPAQVGAYLQPKHQGVSARVEFSIFYDSNNAEDTAKAEALYDAAGKALIAEGAYFSRPYGRFAEMQLPEGKGSTERLKKLKGIFDPNNVLNPGHLSDWANK